MSDDQQHNIEETFVIPSADTAMDQVYRRFITNYQPFGFESTREAIPYHPLPYVPEDDDALLLPHPWRIELEMQIDSKRQRLGLDLYGDVVLGRGESEPGRIIIDLSPYGAAEQGVSRMHMMIRPTPTRLFAIDQGSTNQTTINGNPSGRGIATELNDQDMLAMGNLVLMLSVISRPADHA